MARLTYALIVANLATFLLEMQYGDAFLSPLVLWPIGDGFRLWQLVTSGFLHANVTHLATNMFGLWMFGRSVESSLGSIRFITLYVASLLTASLAQLIVTGFLSDQEATLGASGAVFGVLAAFAMLFPKRVVVLIFPPIPLPAKVFVTLYAAIELFSGISGTQPNVAHFAHLGGLLGAIVLVKHWARSSPLSSDFL